ncbi:hybrid sensor histidine kinase/response regulator [Kamptonema formosum]|uniref:hybrid sensor histidine kinase/response regulator n=1 Tax=Kamptonema formosum TaxID=331992 RepID=UPI000367BAC1|nr:HAMP domain-containing histidine kinase [Oscillatoria sp. PCC 10802]
MPDLSGLYKRLGLPALGQTSFRRILLSRILLLSVPVLLLGEYVTYRKARSGLLETARQNLPESAVRKGEKIQDSVGGLQASLVSASQTAVLESGSLEASKQFLEQLAQQFPERVQCLQLASLQTGEIAWSSCGNQRLDLPAVPVWPAVRESAFTEVSAVKITALTPVTSEKPAEMAGDRPASGESQLSLVLSAPVYDLAGQLVYALTIQAALIEPETDKPRSLSGYTVVIDHDGTILAHPNASRVGRKVSEEEDKARLTAIVGNALAGNTDFIHLFGFEDGGAELLAGYTAIPSPVAADGNKKWIVLAVTRLDNALAGLEEIQHVLVTLILGLLAANLLATLYLSRDIARPLEQLGDYALRVQARRALDRVPHNFRIREFNQLAEALDSMVERLTAWAEELETAWKEAKVANELKNEFLANTSHELRTPLNAIIGSIRLVRDDCCDDEEEEMEFLQRADDAAIHLLEIINDVLDIAKIEAGTLSVVLEPVDLQKVIEEVIDLQAAEIQNKGLQLIFPKRQTPIAVEADPAKLKQVLLNVVGNALKFTDTGSISISTRIEPVGNGDANGSAAAPGSSFHERHAIVSIRDTGIGIDPSQQHRLFQPFVMVDGKRTRKYGGTGLGLAISRNLMELMKGTITLHSAGPGLGTTVEICLPVLDLLPVSSDKLQV